MEVLINGERYVPEPERPTGTTLLAALEIRISCDAGDNITIRDYLCYLLEKVWVEEEGFNGKRPFGNSGWQWDIWVPLGEAGFLPSYSVGEHGEPHVDRPAARAFVGQLIRAAFYGVRDENT